MTETVKDYKFHEKPVPCVALMSGTGSNAEALLEYERTNPQCPYKITAIVTDAPETSRAAVIARNFDLPLVEHDIRKFYLANGEDSIKMDTPRRRELRDEWSEELYEKIMVYSPAFAFFAGFVPLSNIARHLPCLNVHPGDLTRCDENGRRLYTGLHVLPVERAILGGEKFLRSSVILVQPYTGNGQEEVDGGPIIGISAPLPVDLGHYSLSELEEFKKQRVPGTKVNDPLRTMAFEHIERLKTAGDHVVFPRAAAEFAAGAFSCDTKNLFYNGKQVQSVVYSTDSAPQPLLAGE